MPLTDTAVEAALTPPAAAVLRVQAGSIHHPMLSPVRIQPGEAMSPDEAAIVAVLVNPSLKAVRDERRLAAAQLLQAGLLPNPSIAWTNEFPYAGPDHLIAYNIGISWEVSALVSYRAKVDAAKAHLSSVDLDIAWQEWQVAQSAKAAAWSVLSLQAQLEAAEQAHKLLQENVKTIQKAVQLQQKTEVDLSAAQAAREESLSTVLEIQRDLAKEKVALARLLGLPAQAPIQLRFGKAPASMPPDAVQLQKGLEDRRLDLLALRRGYDSQEATVRAAVLNRFPRTELGASHARDTAGVYTFGCDVAMDLPLFDRNQGNIAIEAATRKKLFDEFVNRVFEGRNDIAAAVVEIQSLDRQIEAATQAEKVLQRLVNDYEKAVNTGNADVISYYLAINDRNKKIIEILKLKQELIENWINLENASGMYLTATPTGPASQPASQGSAQ